MLPLKHLLQVGGRCFAGVATLVPRLMIRNEAQAVVVVGKIAEAVLAVSAKNV